jgi:hypothetical protein
MHGRSCYCLLAIPLLALAVPVSWGQSDRDLARELRQDAPPQATPISSTRQPIPFPGNPRPFPPPGTPGFSQITRAAGMIFSGKVTSIALASRPGSAVRTVAITFHVERAIRGVSAGRDLTIFQWIGTWTSGQRYRIGDRVLLLLYPPSKLGLTSSVAGPIGRFTIDSLGHIVLTEQHLAAFRTDPILGGVSRVSFADFAQAVARAGRDENRDQKRDEKDEQ